MKLNYKYISLLFIIFFMSVTLVSATNTENQTLIDENENTVLSIDNTQNNEIINTNNMNKTLTAEKGTFTELQNLIWSSKVGDTIILDKDYELDSALVRKHIIIDRTLTIDGAGHTIDGKNSKRIFYVQPASESSYDTSNTIIKNINFINGYRDTNNDAGAAIFWGAENGVLIGCNFTNNIVNTNGGAIYWSGGSGTITNCTFKNNKVGITKTTSYQSGGAIYWASDNGKLYNNLFIDNFALTNGGAITWKGANGNVSNNIFTNNLGKESGGAIYWDGVNGLINNNTFTSNTGELSGGAIYYEATDGVATNNKFIKNIAKTNAGAIRWKGNGGTVTSNYFSENIATLTGGAIYWEGTKGKLTNNQFIKNTANVSAGAVLWNGNSGNLYNNTFTDNTAKNNYGGAIYFKGNSSTLSNSQFKNNKAFQSGGAIYWEGTNGQLINNLFEDSTSQTGSGGAIRWDAVSGTLTDNIFKNSRASQSGGAIYLEGLNCKLIKNTFLKSTASAAGGAVYWNSNNAKISENNFDGSTSTNNYGGAIYFNGASSNINNNNFTNNKAAKSGGALYYNGESNTADNNIFIENNAQSGSGGAICWNGEKATVTKNKFEGNTAQKGTALYGEGNNAKVNTNTFINNEEGDGCLRWEGSAEIKDNKYISHSRETSLNLNNIDTYYGKSSKLTATLLDSNSKGIINKKILITLNNQTTTLITNSNGQVNMEINNLASGNYTATAKFAGDSDYDASSASSHVNINKAPTELVLTDIKDIILGQELAMTATVNATGGTVTFDVDGNRTTLPLLSTGKAIYLFKPALGDHTYNVTATYNPSSNYLTSSASATFTVTRMPTSISGENVTAYIGGKGQLIFTLTDETTSKGIPLTDININFNGQTYTQKTDSKGKITIDLANLGIGTYEATVSYEGDKIFAPSNATATAFVKSTIESQDLVANYGDATYTAKFVDTDGKALSEGTYVSFTIGNDTYREAVDKNGIATLTIDKTPGKYTITNINTITGDETENNITINKMPTETTISGLKDINVGENLTATIKVNATPGTLTTKFNDDTQLVNYTGGDYNIHFNDLDEGTYTLTATFKPENQYYEGSSATVTFKVTKKANILNVETKDIEEGEDAVFDVTASIETGEVTLNINSKSYTKNLTGGKASFTVSNLTADTYKYTVSVAGDKYYEANSTEGTINVKSTKIIIDAPDMEKYYGDSKRFVVTVTDKDKNPLKGISLLIIINGVEYNKNTNDDGSTSIGINLPVNNYTAEIIFKGNEDYSAINTTSNINIKTTIIGLDVVKIEKSPEQYVATFLDSTGKYLPQGEQILFNINGVLYDRSIRENGKARLNLNLEANTYIITAYNTKTGEQSSNTITIKPRIVNNSNVIKYFRNDTQYEVTILDDNGNPVKAGEVVTFNINGVFYERKTNENGTAKLNINLEPKTYIITTEYKNCRAANTIKVLPVLSAKDLTMKYRDGSQFKATLVDGQGNPYYNQTVIFNVNGVFYFRQTDINGTARLNINLMAGKYIITSSYNGSNIANTITINL